MGGGSWLDNGHGDGESLSHVTGSSRDVIGPPTRDSGTWQSRSGKTVVAALAALALIGSAGTAYAIRETLFPSFGAPTSHSVWSNPVEPEEVAETTTTTVTSTTTTVPPTTAAPTSTSLAPVPETATTVEDHPVVVAAEGSGPSSRTGTSGRGSVANTVASTIDDSEEHASTTVSNTGPSVPGTETSGVPTTDDPDSGKGSGGGDNSGSGRSGGGDDHPDPEDDQPDVTNPDD